MAKVFRDLASRISARSTVWLEDSQAKIVAQEGFFGPAQISAVGSGTADGSSTATGVGSAIATGQGAAQGAATVSGIGYAIGQGTAITVAISGRCRANTLTGTLRGTTIAGRWQAETISTKWRAA